MAQENYDLMAARLDNDILEHSLYLVQANEQIIGKITVCNQTAVAATCRVAINPDPAVATPNKNWFRYDYSIDPYKYHDISIVAGPGRDIRVRAGTALSLSFVLMGCRRVLT